MINNSTFLGVKTSPVSDTSLTSKTQPDVPQFRKISSLKQDHLSFSRQTTLHPIELPYILLNLDITLSSTQLKQKLQEEMLLLDTFLSGKQSQNMFTVTKKENNIIKNICQILFRSKNEFTTVQCIIKNSANRYDRLIELKTLSGEQITGEALISTFIKRIVKISKKVKIIKKTENMFINLESEIEKEFERNKIQYKHNLNRMNNETATLMDVVNKEATNYYEIYKIISQENYELGKQVGIFISDFKIKNSDVELGVSLFPSQMKEAIVMIENCVDTFTNYFNFGQEQNEEMLKYVRPAVEKFIFNKIAYILFSIYNAKYAEENNTFIQKQKEINKAMSIEEIMEFLEIREQFRCLENYKENKSSSFLPYKSTIDCINKIEYEQSPKDKLYALLSAGLDLRNTILGINFGKKELKSMDDELPIFIYIVTQISLTNFPAELYIIEDYLKYSNSPDKESKILTNLLSSVLFLNRWKNEKTDI